MRAPTEEEPLILVRTATENIVLGMKLGASRAEFARREAEEARVAREAERAEEVEERRREEGREQSRVAAEARVAREAEADQRWQEMQSAREVFESYVETDMVRYLREEEKPGADATNYFKRELHNLETRKRLEPGGSIPLSRLVYLAYEANKSGKRRPDGGVARAWEQPLPCLQEFYWTCLDGEWRQNNAMQKDCWAFAIADNFDLWLRKSVPFDVHGAYLMGCSEAAGPSSSPGMPLDDGTFVKDNGPPDGRPRGRDSRSRRRRLGRAPSCSARSPHALAVLPGATPPPRATCTTARRRRRRRRRIPAAGAAPREDAQKKIS